MGGTVVAGAAVTILIAIMVKGAVAIDIDGPTPEADKRPGADDTDEVPVAGVPVAFVVEAGDPDVSGAGARRHIVGLPAFGDSILCGLG
jgi:hypothetical protein